MGQKVESQQNYALRTQSGLWDANRYGANVDIDLRVDLKVSTALFGITGVGLWVLRAVQVYCGARSGKIVR